ncbi:class I SAM-dependent methyltransferase [Haloimpatiens sp. FM7330]|uniref:class I SAM-dependent methyltransferase n=1 Tax=Haloimpatiens sp. FM7330 TaxID=3298610 RepID=UPI00363BE771
MQERILDIRKYKFDGNILDIGYDNYGIVYNLCKKNSEKLDIEYADDRSKKDCIKNNMYDYCILFFALKNIWPSYRKKSIFNLIYNLLKEDGKIYIWDIDKGFWKSFKSNIKVIISDNKVKNINVRDYNIFSNNSKQNIIKIVSEKFDIIDFDCNCDMFYIKAKKKGCCIDESIISSN